MGISEHLGEPVRLTNARARLYKYGDEEVHHAKVADDEGRCEVDDRLPDTDLVVACLGQLGEAEREDV